MYAAKLVGELGRSVSEPLSERQIAELRQFDSATIANAIEQFGVRDRTEGFLGMSVRCLFPHLEEPMVGYAVTAKGDSTAYGRAYDPLHRVPLLELLTESPKPGVVVIQACGNRPERSCFCGDVMCAEIKVLGGVGVVTDGGVRDLEAVEALGIHYFAAGVTVSHGTIKLYEIGQPVAIDGVPIRTGDLVHGDANGVVVIPNQIAYQVADAARAVLERERARKDLVLGPDFTLDNYREFLRRHG